MTSAWEIEQRLDGIIQQHYYSEDFELLSSLKAFASTLSGDDLALLEQLIIRRVTSECTLVDIMLCAVVHVPAAALVLAHKLNEAECFNQVTRALIASLACYPMDEAYVAVERFVDSDQEWESLQAICRIDFRRALPHLARLIVKDHLHGTILHILHERVERKGLPGLLDDLVSSSAARSPAFHRELARVLTSKSAAYNPFSDADIQTMLSTLKSSGTG